MEVLIDTNIIIDWLAQRNNFNLHASRVMEECFFGKTKAYLTAHSLCDLFYILRKDFSLEKRLSFIQLLTEQCIIIPEMQEDFIMSIQENCTDLEDALQMQCAFKYNLNYIITRNIQDFEKSKIPAILPQQFLQILADKKIH